MAIILRERGEQLTPSVIDDKLRKMTNFIRQNWFFLRRKKNKLICVLISFKHN